MSMQPSNGPRSLPNGGKSLASRKEKPRPKAGPGRRRAGPTRASSRPATPTRWTSGAWWTSTASSRRAKLALTPSQTGFSSTVTISLVSNSNLIQISQINFFYNVEFSENI